MYVTDSVMLTPDFTNTSTMPRGMLSFAKHSWRLGSFPAHWESANVDARWCLLLESGREIDSPMECHTPKHADAEQGKSLVYLSMPSRTLQSNLDVTISDVTIILK
jgi:hypothetical protein